LASNWRKSSYSGGSGGSCVEVADTTANVVMVRDTTDRKGGTLAFTSNAWLRFTSKLK
jgi:hypothetical protein